MTDEEQDNAIKLLDQLKQVVEDEQRLFGGVLLFEKPSALIFQPSQPNTIGESQTVMEPSSQNPENIILPPKKIQIVKEAPEVPSMFESPKIEIAPITTEAWGKATSMDQLNSQICECLKCALGSTRTKFVFGVGNPKATLMFIGEAPGADEDAQGEPFVGRAGQLLTKIIEAIHFKRSDVYICNILKCRPPNNRKPTLEESELCKPYLKKQIELVKPKVIVCLGLTAAENLLGTKEAMGKLRGRVMEYEGVPVMITYHPAALLRNPNWKRPTWEDVQAVRKLHDELVAKN
jgi:uracil-DNA glycosylase